MSQKLKLSDLLKDNSFVQWLKEGQPVDDRQWQIWYEEDPSHKTLVDDAYDILRGVPFREKHISELDSQVGWEKIKIKIAKENLPSFHNQFHKILKIAASICLLIIAGFAVNEYNKKAQWTTFQTAFGETKTIHLPDSTAVILGANSKLTYNVEIFQKENRELQLSGQAYFRVMHLEKDMPFKVQVRDLQVEVLGTSFNINDYTNNTVVSLVEGSLRLSKQINNVTNNKADDLISILLEPQQTAWFDNQQQRFVINKEQTRYWTSWIDDKWSFGSGTPLSKVLAKIEAVYGLECVVKNSNDLDRELAGELTVESPEVLFEAIAVYLNRQVTQQGEQLIIE